MRTVLLLALLAAAACGNKPPAGGDDTLPDDLRGGGEPAPRSLTELEKRQGAACEQLGPRLTDCAIADARATMTPEQLAELDVERTAPLHTREMIAQCKEQPMSSRQVRVHEVCLHEETECDALTACLEHAKPEASESDPR